MDAQASTRVDGADGDVSEAAVFTRSTLALLVAFLPLAFSEDLLTFTAEELVQPVATSWWLPVLDIALYGVIAVLLWPIPHFRLSHWARGLFLASLGLTVGLDCLAAALGWMPRWLELIMLVAYLVAQALIYASIAMTGEKLTRPTRGMWAVGGPLLAGTALTWFLGLVQWSGLQRVSESGAQWRAGEYFAPARVDQEYFAQLSQLLPVLIVALAVELRVFDGTSVPSAARRARTAVVAGIAGAGTFAAVLSLPRQDGDDVMLSNVELWAEYLAYVLTINAVSVAVVALVWALIADRPQA